MNRDLLRNALDLAKIREGFCAPNPSVGALVAKEGRRLALGYHLGSGHPHAEIEALQILKESESQGATLICTLEPCCHWGRTPPCTDRIIQAGVAKVVYGYTDPNPRVSGKGAQLLKEAGIEVSHLPLEEIDQFYTPYTYWVQKGLPWLTAKMAMSLDGKIAGVERTPVRITGQELSQLTHEERRQSDALFTTAETILRDNPQFSVRTEDPPIRKPLYILDTHLRLTLQERVFDTCDCIILFHGKEADPKKIENFQSQGITCTLVDHNESGLDLTRVMQIIAQHGHYRVWAEVGARCFRALVEARLTRRVFLYVAPKILGPSGYAAFEDQSSVFEGADQYRWQQFGTDALCELRWN